MDFYFLSLKIHHGKDRPALSANGRRRRMRPLTTSQKNLGSCALALVFLLAVLFFSLAVGRWIKRKCTAKRSLFHKDQIFITTSRWRSNLMKISSPCGREAIIGHLIFLSFVSFLLLDETKDERKFRWPMVSLRGFHTGGLPFPFPIYLYFGGNGKGGP